MSATRKLQEAKALLALARAAPVEEPMRQVIQAVEEVLAVVESLVRSTP